MYVLSSRAFITYTAADTRSEHLQTQTQVVASSLHTPAMT
jgi:hypothetical protein